MRLTLSKFMGLFARILCVAAVVSIGFSAEASGNLRELSAAEIAAYMLPDGTLPALCVTVPDGSGQGKIVKLGSDTLGLHSAVALPVPSPSFVTLKASGGELLFPPKAAQLRHLLYPPGSGPRAPPASA